MCAPPSTGTRPIGFTVVETHDNGRGGLSFAILSLGSSEVMFNQDGQPSTRSRREVDLYVYTEEVDDLYRRLEVEWRSLRVLMTPFMECERLIIRDLNRFWITFGQTSVTEAMNAVGGRALPE